ncbi:unnamed protein product [Closterium sp. Naga37s-1]|nr:unnamed protein product [Closterium sp. Naga37s-1]
MPISNRSIAMLLSCHPKGKGGRESCQVGEGRRVMREEGEGEQQQQQGTGESEGGWSGGAVGEGASEAGACGVGASGEGPIEYVVGQDAAGDTEAGAFEATVGGGGGRAFGMGACEVTLIEKMEIAVSGSWARTLPGPPPPTLRLRLTHIRLAGGGHWAVGTSCPPPSALPPVNSSPPVFEWRVEGHGFLISLPFFTTPCQSPFPPQRPHITVGTHPPRPVSSDPSDSAPPVFEWRVEGHGFLISRGFNHTAVDIRVGGSRLQANLTNQRHWNPSDPGAGPEGWAAQASQLVPGGLGELPCRWFVNSLGSTASYRFWNESEGVEVEGRGWAHEEKNWGAYFPAGHVWMQGMSSDNTVQLVGAGAFFRFASLPSLPSPLILSLGLRTPHHSFDFRSIDPLTSFSPPTIDSCSGRFSLAARTPTAALRVRVRAAPSSFSGAVWMPRGDGDWDATGRESFRVHGEGAGRVYKYTIYSAALEFAGEYECKHKKE